MGETRDHLEEHGGAGTVMCGKLGQYIAWNALCESCPRRLCASFHSGEACEQCEEECPDWEADQEEG